tara:strand:+ start:9817 stop:10416 length:600 start_codon:yes stop_codon:yes gene_type:complete
MAINLPNADFTSSSFVLMFNTQTYGNGTTNQVQRKSTTGAKWVATYTLPPQKRATYADWQVFFALLQGRLNTFNGYDPNGVTARGIATGTPIVKGASQTGNTLITDGWTINQTGIMKKGDYFSVNNELKMITADSNSDGSGDSTLTFEPPLRNSPADNAPLTVSTASCEMILLTDQVNFQVNKSMVSSPIVIQAVEVFS